ncbi:hypothetical protein [Flavobacterium granuli]|uniref:Phage tail protein n=1 Tax=Flavobacterium granuli TaxID=280093 RepID=A0ABU1S0D0_9FLAO|nr:hypothetical protein [Flavobacterium granuli]MDR6844493.1 hypothetical protein [Flavobacterium granuli]
MELLDKVKTNPNICGVELAFNGDLIPSKILDWQQFHNSLMSGTDFTKAHFGLASVSFGEESETVNSGPLYKQSVTIRFPSTDEKRAERLAMMMDVKFLKLKLTNGLDLVIGRNDFKQNARPKIEIKTNIKTAEATFKTVSISPSGYVPNPNSYGLPAFIPLTLY